MPGFAAALTPMTLIRPITALLLAAALAPLPAAAQDARAARFYEDALARREARDFDGAIVQLKNALQADGKMLAAHLLLGKLSLQNASPGAAEAALGEALRLGANRSEVAAPLGQAMLMQGKHSVMLVDERLQPEGLPPGPQAELLLLRASAHMDLGEARKALTAIEAARRLTPERVDTWLVEVPLRIRAQALPEARRAADQALRMAPEAAEAHYLLGTVLHAQGQLEAALQAYQGTLRRDAKHLEAQAAAAGLALDLGQREQAQQLVKALLATHPKDPRGSYLQALLAEQAGDTAQAQASLRQVVELLDAVPIDRIRFRPQMLVLAALSHHALGSVERAKPFLELVARQQPRSPAVKLLAQILINEGQVENGVQVLENYLRGSPNDLQALALLASGQSAAGRPHKATALMQQALTARANNDEVRAAFGLSLLRAGQFSEARSALETAYAARPQDAANAQALAMLYLRIGEGALAVPVARRVLALEPKQAGSQHLLGLALAAAGDAGGARAAFERALQMAPTLVDSQVSLARLDAQAGKHDAAQRRLLGVLQRQPQAVEPMLELGRQARLRQQMEESARWLERAATTAPPKDLRGSFALVDVLLSAGKTERAIAAANALVARAPDDALAQQALALTHLSAGDKPSARTALTAASRRQTPTDPAWLTEIAQLQWQVDDVAGAASSLDRLLAVHPKHAPALLLRASAELALGQIDAAEARWRQLQTLQPRLATTHLLQADIATARRQPAAALEALRRAHATQPGTGTQMRLFLHLAQNGDSAGARAGAEGWLARHPRDTAVLKALANLHASERQWGAARQHFERLVRATPSDADAHNSLANVLLAQGDLKAARASAERAVRLAPSLAIAIDTLGWVRFQQGEREAALGLLREALLRAPEHAEIRYHLAAVLAAVGKREEARREVQAALAKPLGLESLDAARQLAASLK